MDNTRKLQRLSKVAYAYQQRLVQLLYDSKLREWWYLSRLYSRFTKRHAENLRALDEIPNDVYIWLGYSLHDVHVV